MPIRDVAAQCASLANDYGANHGPNSPATFHLALLIVDPDNPGELIECPNVTTIYNDDDTEAVVPNGYARAAVPNNGTTFPPPDPETGELTTAVIDDFPVSLAEYPAPIVGWRLMAGNVAWDEAALPEAERVTVDDPGTHIKLILSIFYNEFASTDMTL